MSIGPACAGGMQKDRPGPAAGRYTFNVFRYATLWTVSSHGSSTK